MNRQQFLHRLGPWAVITGASDGIGCEMARGIAAMGVNVVLVARRYAKLVELSRELSEAGVGTKVLAVDLATREGRQELMRETQGLDIGLFVAAAGFGSVGDFVTRDIERELGMIDLNISAVTELTHHVARRLSERGRGCIVLFSSITAFQGVPHSAVYSATKAYNQSLAEALRHELAGAGVDVLSIAPATVASGFAARAGMRMSSGASAATVGRAAVRALGKRGTMRPGALAKMLELALKVPRGLRVRIMGLVMSGMDPG